MPNLVMAYKRQRSEDNEYKEYYREEDYFPTMTPSNAPDSPESVMSYSPDSPLSVSSYPDSDPPSPASPPSQFSPSHSPTQSSRPVKKCRYTTIYDEMLRPLSPATILPFPTTCTTRNPPVNKDLQQEFLKLVGKGSNEQLGQFLEQHSENLSINQYSQDGLTPLQRVCQDGAVNALPVARLLVQHGADPKLTSRDGWSPVHLASFSGNSALMLYMIKCPK